jgi:hypothetical protein
MTEPNIGSYFNRHRQAASKLAFRPQTPLLAKLGIFWTPIFRSRVARNLKVKRVHCVWSTIAIHHSVDTQSRSDASKEAYDNIQWRPCSCIRSEDLRARPDDKASTVRIVPSGVATRFERVAKPRFFRIWCGMHQLDLVMQAFFFNIWLMRSFINGWLVSFHIYDDSRASSNRWKQQPKRLRALAGI